MNRIEHSIRWIRAHIVPVSIAAIVVIAYSVYGFISQGGATPPDPAPVTAPAADSEAVQPDTTSPAESTTEVTTVPVPSSVIQPAPTAVPAAVTIEPATTIAGEPGGGDVLTRPAIPIDTFPEEGEPIPGPPPAAVTTTALPPVERPEVNEAHLSLVDRVVAFNKATNILPDDTGATRKERVKPYCDATYWQGLNLDLDESNADRALKGATITVELTTDDVNAHFPGPNTAIVTARATVTKTMPDEEDVVFTIPRASTWQRQNGVWVVMSADGIGT